MTYPPPGKAQISIQNNAYTNETVYIQTGSSKQNNAFDCILD